MALGLDVSGGLKGWSASSLANEAPIKNQVATTIAKPARKYLIVSVKDLERDKSV